jgi:hypothetical protein
MGLHDAPPGTGAAAPPAVDDPAKRIIARKVAILVARNKSTQEIAAELSISEDRVRTLKKSPLFQEMVQLIEEKIIEHGVNDVVRELLDDAPVNFKFIKDVRDGKVVDNAKDLTVRLRASQMLWDRQVPEQKSENEERTVSLVISGGLLNQMVRGMRNDGGVVDAEVVEALPEAKPVVPMTSDEFIQRYIVEQEQKALQEDED